VLICPSNRLPDNHQSGPLPTLRSRVPHAHSCCSHTSLPRRQVELTLVINKVDRLILELRLTPQQAYERMKAIITQVNMIVSAFQSEKYISEADVVLGLQDSAAQANARCVTSSFLTIPDIESQKEPRNDCPN